MAEGAGVAAQETLGGLALLNNDPKAVLTNLAEAAKERYERKGGGVNGAVAAINVLNPFAQIGEALQASEAAARSGDAKEYGRQVTHAIIAGAPLRGMFMGMAGPVARPPLAAVGGGEAVVPLGGTSPKAIPGVGADVAAISGPKLAPPGAPLGAADDLSAAQSKGGSAAPGAAKPASDAAKPAFKAEARTKTIKNSARESVIRTLVSNEDELLAIAEEAAGGRLDAWTEFKTNYWISPDGKKKIEFNLEGHKTTNE
ncbi:hypothetical protein [Sorangium sp. So ce128]|uniref:hypothetical protein n=1 Tax=Sorangium sp. So ce128 TaxID=3133281 RepID=UPI003F604DAE